MKHPIRMLVFGLAAVCSTYASAYSGELWLSQANQRFGTPPNMLAHGFLAGVVHSWNNRKESRFPDLCFNAPARSNANQKPYGDRKRLYQRPKP